MTLIEALERLYARARIAGHGPGAVAWGYLCEGDSPMPDLDRLVRAEDPMVLGCLLALYREATNDNTALVEPNALVWSHHYDGPWKAGHWADDILVWGPSAPTEGEALAAALIALVTP